MRMLVPPAEAHPWAMVGRQLTQAGARTAVSVLLHTQGRGLDWLLQASQSCGMKTEASACPLSSPRPPKHWDAAWGEATGSLDSCRAESRQMWDSAMVEGKDSRGGERAGLLGWQPQSRVGCLISLYREGVGGVAGPTRLLVDLPAQV